MQERRRSRRAPGREKIGSCLPTSGPSPSRLLSSTTSCNSSLLRSSHKDQTKKQMLKEEVEVLVSAAKDTCKEAIKMDMDEGTTDSSTQQLMSICMTPIVQQTVPAVELKMVHQRLKGSLHRWK